MKKKFSLINVLIIFKIRLKLLLLSFAILNNFDLTETEIFFIHKSSFPVGSKNSVFSPSGFLNPEEINRRMNRRDKKELVENIENMDKIDCFQPISATK